MLNPSASSMLPMTKSIAKQRVNLIKNVQGPKRRVPKRSCLIRRCLHTTQARQNTMQVLQRQRCQHYELNDSLCRPGILLPVTIKHTQVVTVPQR